MISIKRIILDVLKPHVPDCINFTSAIAEKCPGATIELTVDEVDEKTESVILYIDGENLDYETISKVITNLGGSVHSIDKVQVLNIEN